MTSGIPLGYMLSRSRRVFKNQMASEFKNEAIDLTFEQYVILKLLDLNADFIQQDLADRLQKDKSSFGILIYCWSINLWRGLQIKRINGKKI